MQRLLSLFSPAQLVVLAFAALSLLGGILLMLPLATESGESASPLTALFTSISAVTVTGLAIVDTPSYWSTFGELVILSLIQVGGFGIMALGSLLLIVLARRVGLKFRLLAQAELGALTSGDIRRLVLGIALVSVLFESAVALILGLRFWGRGQSAGEAIYHGIFHAVSAFNNAGFALRSDSLVTFVGDPIVILVVSVAIIAGGLGVPVWLDLYHHWRRPRLWSLTSKLVLLMTFFLLVGGTLAFYLFELTNPATLGALSWPEQLLASFFQSVSPRTAGFNSLDYGHMRPETLLTTDMLMFAGSGPISTGGGIKLTTLALIFFMVRAVTRGDESVEAFERRVPHQAERQALVISFIAMTAVVAAAILILAGSDISAGAALFEAFSAFGTVGLSTGATPELPAYAQSILAVLMFIGRVGPYTLALALLLREGGRRYKLAEERPVLG